MFSQNKKYMKMKASSSFLLLSVVLPQTFGFHVHSAPFHSRSLASLQINEQMPSTKTLTRLRMVDLVGSTQELASTLQVAEQELASTLQVAEASISSNPLGFFLWLVPVLIFLRAVPLTSQSKVDLANIGNGFTPVSPKWEVVEQMNGGRGRTGLLNHIKYGSPGHAMYLAASLCAFPLMAAGGIVDDIGSVFTISGGALLAISLGNAFKAVKPSIITVILLLVTLPMFQLIAWEIEYSLRIVNGNPDAFALPEMFLNFVHATNFFYPPCVNPLMNFYSLSFLPEGWSHAGQAVVQSLVQADKYATPTDIPSDMATLSLDQIKVINNGLNTQMLYGFLAPVPMWAIFTNFGIEKVDAPFTRCVFSKSLLKILGKDNFAEEGVSGFVGKDFFLYLTVMFAWLIYGVEVYSVYTGA